MNSQNFVFSSLLIALIFYQFVPATLFTLAHWARGGIVFVFPHDVQLISDDLQQLVSDGFFGNTHTIPLTKKAEVCTLRKGRFFRSFFFIPDNDRFAVLAFPNNFAARRVYLYRSSKVLDGQLQAVPAWKSLLCHRPTSLSQSLPQSNAWSHRRN